MPEKISSILVTGGAGFIGSTFVRQWLRHEQESIVNLDKLTYAGSRESLDGVFDDPKHCFVEGDIADARLVGRLLEENRPWAIVHLAAESHVDRSINMPPQFAMTNVVGTCVLLDAAVKYWQSLDQARQQRFRFLLVSTDEVFGSAEPEQRFNEQSPLAPNSPYSATKASAEHLARAFSHTYGLPVLTVNPSNNYGPRQLPEKLIPKMILSAIANHPLTVYGDGLHQRDWLHVDDCCRAIRQILRHGQPGERYLVGADNRLANLHVVETICDLVDKMTKGKNRRQLISFVPDRPGHDRRYAVDATRLRNELGWQPEVQFDTGLRETIRWYLKNHRWIEQAAQSLRGAAKSR